MCELNVNKTNLRIVKNINLSEAGTLVTNILLLLVYLVVIVWNFQQGIERTKRIGKATT